MSNHADLANQVSIIRTFRNLIVYFLERQQLVVLAMLEVSPVLLEMENANIPSIELTPYIEVFKERQANIRDPEKFFRGIWKHDWEYRLHGIGCRLTHISTKEPLEWDAPNSETFRFDWFWEHLLWRIKNEQEDPYVKASIEWLNSFSEAEIYNLLKENMLLRTGVDGISILI